MPKTKKKPSKRKPNPAFMRPVQPDDKLAAIVGSQPLPRSELTKKLWNYIKRHGCQDKKKRTMINADDSLRPVDPEPVYSPAFVRRAICGLQNNCCAGR
jgi:chromatin remodeling complex protein RSC6